MTKCVIVGSGVAALAAAWRLSQNSSNEITLITADSELGKKYLVTGNGRCNIGNSHAFNPTNFCYVSAGKFITSSFTEKDKTDYYTYLKQAGIDLYEDEEGRLYPFSFSAINVQLLLSGLLDGRIKTVFNTIITKVDFSNNIVSDSREKNFSFDKLIIAVGGLSSQYPDLLAPLSLKAEEKWPALTALTPNFTWPKRIIGQRVRGTLHIQLSEGEYIESGELLFKEKELTGIMIYNASLLIKSSESFSIDFTSYNDHKVVDCASFLSYLPNKVANVASELPLEDGKLSFQASLPSSFAHAQVMGGGIALSELNLSNMSLKKFPKIHLIGEVLDFTGLCGGYNIAAAIVQGLRIK